MPNRRPLQLRACPRCETGAIANDVGEPLHELSGRCPLPTSRAYLACSLGLPCQHSQSCISFHVAASAEEHNITDCVIQRVMIDVVDIVPWQATVDTRPAAKVRVHSTSPEPPSSIRSLITLPVGVTLASISNPTTLPATTTFVALRPPTVVAGIHCEGRPFPVGGHY